MRDLFPIQENLTSQPLPNGLALWGVDFTWAANLEILRPLKWGIIPALALHVAGVVPWLALPYLTVLSLAVGTPKNSQGEIA